MWVLPDFRYNRGICLEGLGKVTEILNQDNLYSRRDSNQLLPEYKSHALPLETAYSLANNIATMTTSRSYN
jgi:hypothetical protein